MHTLHLPVGLRPLPATPQEIPLQEGFFYTPLEENKDAFRFTALASSEKIPSILRSFCALLPGEAFFILEHYPEDPSTIDWSDEALATPTIAYSPYMPTDEIMDALDPYLLRLIHDGFVGFGLANSRAGIEFFYSEEKVLTFFSGNHLQISSLLQQQGLRYQPHMRLPTDIEHEHLSLLHLGRSALPKGLQKLAIKDRDYRRFCSLLTEQLEMYQVSDGPSFFLTKKEQDQIEDFLRNDSSLNELCDEEFGNLLLDWIDFVDDCQNGFQGGLDDYTQALQLRDIIQTVATGVDSSLSHKIIEIVQDADQRFTALLIDSHKRLDRGGQAPDRFWHCGMVRNPGSTLRRDLIRRGWYR